MSKYIIRGEDDAEKFGINLGKSLKSGDVVALIGDLGSGKTTLTKAIAKGIGIREELTSPTFNIVCQYNSGRIPLYHFDVYRVNDPDELFEIGFEEYFHKGGICIVEWADLVIEMLPEDSKIIFIDYGKDEKERVYSCTF